MPDGEIEAFWPSTIVTYATDCQPGDAGRGLARGWSFLSSSSFNILLLCGGLYGELYGRPYNTVLSSGAGRGMFYAVAMIYALREAGCPGPPGAVNRVKRP
jgi:hypothetical protein